MYDTRSQFRDAIASAGLEPPDQIPPGKFVRFPGHGKRRGTAGWCKLFPDGRAGVFGDHSTGLSERWLARRDKPLSRSERAAIAREVEQTKAWMAEQQRAAQRKAAVRAATIWNAASPAPEDHPYLRRKRVGRHDARLHRESLVLPIRHFSGALTSLQFIARDGGKLLLSDGRKRGCFIQVSGSLIDPSRVAICEGWATGATLAEDEPGLLVLAAIDAYNLEPVAVAARERWPATEIVIAGDDDRSKPGNIGATKALSAATAADALLVLPPWPEGAPNELSDFNDLATWLAEVRHDHHIS